MGQTGEFVHNCLREEYPAVRKGASCLLQLSGHTGLWDNILWGEQAVEGKTWAMWLSDIIWECWFCLAESQPSYGIDTC